MRAMLRRSRPRFKICKRTTNVCIVEPLSIVFTPFAIWVNLKYQFQWYYSDNLHSNIFLSKYFWHVLFSWSILRNFFPLLILEPRKRHYCVIKGEWRMILLEASNFCSWRKNTWLRFTSQLFGQREMNVEQNIKCQIFAPCMLKISWETNMFQLHQILIVYHSNYVEAL